MEDYKPNSHRFKEEQFEWETGKEKSYENEGRLYSP